MAKQLHKRFSDEEVKMLLEKYLSEKVELSYLLEILAIKRRRFFELLKEYRRNPARFSVQYERKKETRRISKQVEENITKELEIERRLIENKEIPLKTYNYSYIKDQIYKKYHQKVSLPTIIGRAKREGFYLPSKRKKKEHTREVLTNYIGQLIQHDSSHTISSHPTQKKDGISSPVWMTIAGLCSMQNW